MDKSGASVTFVIPQTQGLQHILLVWATTALPDLYIFDNSSDIQRTGSLAFCGKRSISLEREQTRKVLEFD